MASKKFKKLSDDEVWRRWNERMKRARQDLHHVFSTRGKFREVTSLFEKNDELKACGGAVWDWLFSMYARDLVIAIRRELDNDTNTVCLGRLLTEMSQRPQVITRRRYLGDIAEDDFRYQMLNHTLNGYGVVRVTGPDTDSLNDYLDPAGIAADRQHLLKVAKPVIAWANQLIAHRSEIEEVKVTLGDVNRSVDAIEEAFVKYFAIICGPSLMGLEPSIIGDWMKPFTIPWIKPEARA
jgi:hypothetical protein